MNKNTEAQRKRRLDPQVKLREAEAARLYRKNRVEVVSETQRKYHLKPEVKLRHSQWNKRPENKLKKALKRASPEARAKDREQYASTPEMRLTQKLRHEARSCLSAKRNDHIDSLGCTKSFFQDHMESQFQDGMTWDNYGEWQLDHKKPIASFDLSDPDQVKQAFHYSNCQPLWAEDNAIKGDKIIVD